MRPRRRPARGPGLVGILKRSPDRLRRDDFLANASRSRRQAASYRTTPRAVNPRNARSAAREGTTAFFPCRPYRHWIEQNHPDELGRGSDRDAPQEDRFHVQTRRDGPAKTRTERAGKPRRRLALRSAVEGVWPGFVRAPTGVQSIDGCSGRFALVPSPQHKSVQRPWSRARGTVDGTRQDSGMAGCSRLFGSYDQSRTPVCSGSRFSILHLMRSRSGFARRWPGPSLAEVGLATTGRQLSLESR